MGDRLGGEDALATSGVGRMRGDVDLDEEVDAIGSAGETWVFREVEAWEVGDEGGGGAEVDGEEEEGVDGMAAAAAASACR